jgi:elongation factor P--(R)-beta-lysine ligase
MSNEHQLRFDCIQTIRDFFLARHYSDVLTPIIVENPGMEVHLHPFSIFSESSDKKHSGYLHTSPEFFMKELLVEGFNKIFTINYCFRDEPKSSTHRRQFLMLEWYRTQAKLQDFIEETILLVEHCLEALERKGHDIDQKLKETPFVIQTVEELFIKYLNLPILNYLEATQLKEWILLNRSHLLKDHEELWPYEDYFFLLFLNEIEPQLQKIPKLILKEYPAPLAALSTLSEENPKACLRFEMYLNGVEIANCFQEESSAQIIEERFKQQADQKKQLYGYSLEQAQRFLQVMQRGLPSSSGIALGIERLAGQLCKKPIPFWD